MWSDDELARRKPVWLAMSELFLDTELDDRARRHLAVTLADSGYDDGELDSIMTTEVAPVCLPNLLEIAGEWAGFDEQWLFDAILAHHARGSAAPSLGGDPIWRGPWNEIAELIRRLRQDARGLAVQLASVDEATAITAARDLALQGTRARGDDVVTALRLGAGDARPALRAACVEALGTVLLADALADGEKAIADPSHEVRVRGLAVMRTALEERLCDAPGVPLYPDDRDALALLVRIEAFRRDPDPRVRACTSTVAGLVGRAPGVGAAALGFVLHSLGDTDFNARMATREAVRSCAVSDAAKVAALAALLSSGDERQRLGAAQGFVGLTSQRGAAMASALGPLRGALADPSVDVRESALWAIGWLRDAAAPALADIAAAVGSADPRVKAAALQTAGRLGRAALALDASVIAALGHADSMVRRAAIEAVEGLGPEVAARCRERLQELVEDPDVLTRVLASRITGR